MRLLQRSTEVVTNRALYFADHLSNPENEHEVMIIASVFVVCLSIHLLSKKLVPLKFP
jgi:hypothetical protein